jgi:hypothetical protein
LGWCGNFARPRRLGGDLGDADDASMIRMLRNVLSIRRTVIEGRSYRCLLVCGFGLGISRPQQALRRTRGRVSADPLAEHEKNG